MHPIGWTTNVVRLAVHKPVRWSASCRRIFEPARTQVPGIASDPITRDRKVALKAQVSGRQVCG